MARVLSYFFLAGAGLTAFAMLFLPLPASADDTACWALIGVAAAVGGGLYGGAGRIPVPALHAGLVAGIVVISLGVHFFGRTSGEVEIFYLWVGFYAFYFFPVRLAAVHLGLVGAGYGATLALTGPAGSAGVRWLLTMGTLAVAGALLAKLVRRLRTAATESERSEERTSSILDQAHEAYVAIDSEDRVTAWNAHAEHIFGWRREEVLGRGLRDHVIPERHRQAYREQLEQYLQTGQSPMIGGLVEIPALRRDGSEFRAEMTIAARRDSDGCSFHAFIHDISARKEADSALRDAEERFRRAFDDAAIGMALVSNDGRWLRVNRALTAITGYSPEELVGMRFRDITHPEDLDEDLEALRALVAGERANFATEKRYIHAAGHEVWVQLNVTVVRDDKGRMLYLISQMQDITERKRAEAELAHQALHDPLTGLPNRLLFLDRVEVALNRLDRRDSALAVLFLDLDRFKLVNDSHGHVAGDAVLMDVTRRLRSRLRPGDTLSRFGGDEFTMVCEDLRDAGEAVVVAERLSEVFTEPFELDGREVFLSASIGIAMSQDAGAQPEALLRDADTAMYRAKERGRSRHALFDGRMRLRGAERLETETALRHALERDELRVHYQPLVDLETGDICGVESLVRWQHPERGLIAPAEFIPVAEESGLIVPIGELVLDAACRSAVAWDAEHGGAAGPWLAVNLSVRQLADPRLQETVARTLEATGLPGDRLYLEITESAVMEDPEGVLIVLGRLKELGVKIAIDDFGVGFSSLSHVRHLAPVDMLKIDRSFIAGLGTNREDAAIVSAVISMAHSLELIAVAEGIETEEHVATLHELGCDQGQGFHFARPRPADEIPGLFRAAAHGELRA